MAKGKCSKCLSILTEENCGVKILKDGSGYCAKCKSAHAKQRQDGLCEHGKTRRWCKECTRKSFCSHDKLKHRCKDCGGREICEHGINRYKCKKCGTKWRLSKAGFSVEEIKLMGAVEKCQFPRCGIRPSRQSLCSDHAHEGPGSHKKGEGVTRQNYRGEVCQGCNRRLKDLDAHPEWANDEEKEYMSSRPYAR